MGFFRRDKDSHQDKDSTRPNQRSPTESFLAGFNAGAAACVALPLVLLAFNALRDGGGGGGDEEGAVARGFVYLWSLLACAALVRVANDDLAPRPDGGNDGGVLDSVTKIFSDNNDRGIDGRKAKTLIVALLMFANLCLLCAVLILGVGEGGAEELGRSIGEGQFIGTIFLTFVFWLAWSLGSSFALHRIAKGGSGNGSREGDENMGYWAT